MGASWAVLHPKAGEPPTAPFLMAGRDRSMGEVIDQLAPTTAHRSLVLLARGATHADLACPDAATTLCETPAGADDTSRLAALFAVSCPDLGTAFQALAGMDTWSRPSLIAGAVREMPSPTCACSGLDLDLLEYASLRLAGALDPGYVAFPHSLPLSDADRALTVAAWVAAHTGP
jgi:hypothetical protein